MRAQPWAHGDIRWHPQIAPAGSANYYVDNIRLPWASSQFHWLRETSPGVLEMTHAHVEARAPAWAVVSEPFVVEGQLVMFKFPEQAFSPGASVHWEGGGGGTAQIDVAGFSGNPDGVSVLPFSVEVDPLQARYARFRVLKLKAFFRFETPPFFEVQCTLWFPIYIDNPAASQLDWRNWSVNVSGRGSFPTLPQGGAVSHPLAYSFMFMRDRFDADLGKAPLLPIGESYTMAHDFRFPQGWIKSGGRAGNVALRNQIAIDPDLHANDDGLLLYYDPPPSEPEATGSIPRTTATYWLSHNYAGVHRVMQRQSAEIVDNALLPAPPAQVWGQGGYHSGAHEPILRQEILGVTEFEV